MTQDEIEMRVARLLQAQQDRDKVKALTAEVERLKDDIARRDSEADLAIVEGGK